MIKRLIGKLLMVGTLVVIGIVATPWLLQSWVRWRVDTNIYAPESVPPNNVALVLGAGLWRDGTPTPVLHDRVATAVDLYNAGTVQKLLLSGDNPAENYNEPEAMRQLATQMGVPEQDIVLDYAGRRTYDSCFRAREIFQVEQAVVVTQQFHLHRALYLCNSLGVDAVGAVADKRSYRPQWQRFWQLREVAAIVRALLDIHILQPKPVLGDKLPIEIVQNQATPTLNTSHSL